MQDFSNMMQLTVSFIGFNYNSLSSMSL